jgi:hypothetical protein
MAENIVTLHPAPVKRPLTSAERGRAFRERQKNRSAVKSAETVEKPQTFANVRPTFSNTAPTFDELERSTAALVAACKRGMEAAREMRTAMANRKPVILSVP